MTLMTDLITIVGVISGSFFIQVEVRIFINRGIENRTCTSCKVYLNTPYTVPFVCVRVLRFVRTTM